MAEWTWRLTETARVDFAKLEQDEREQIAKKLE